MASYVKRVQMKKMLDMFCQYDILILERGQNDI